MALIQTIEADKAKGRTLAAFVMKAIMTPDAVNKADMDKLHDLGVTKGKPKPGDNDATVENIF
jgi:hypothetical protein